MDDGTEACGEHPTAVYFIIKTYKFIGIDPQAHIADIIEKVAGDWPAD